MGEDIKVYKVLVGKPEGKGQLGRPWIRQEDVKRMDTFLVKYSQIVTFFSICRLTLSLQSERNIQHIVNVHLLPCAANL
jgi:hypothetical protein